MRYLIPLAAALALSACAGMTPQQVAGTASSGLYAAAETAQAVGRQQIAVDDLERAVALDDAARADLVAAIERADRSAGTGNG